MVVSAPVYALNDEAEIDRHLRMIADAVDVPVFAYDVPVRVHTKLGRDLLINLGRDGVLTGVKDSSGDDVAFRRLVAANAEAGHPLQLLTGHEVMVDGMLLLGADGAVPGLANVDPAGYRRLWDAAQAGDWATARAEQDRLAQLFEIAFVPKGMSGDAGGIGAFKAAMARLGVMDSAAMPVPARAPDRRRPRAHRPDPRRRWGCCSDAGHRRRPRWHQDRRGAGRPGRGHRGDPHRPDPGRHRPRGRPRHRSPAWSRRLWSPDVAGVGIGTAGVVDATRDVSCPATETFASWVGTDLAGLQAGDFRLGVADARSRSATMSTPTPSGSTGSARARDTSRC